MSAAQQTGGISYQPAHLLVQIQDLVVGDGTRVGEVVHTLELTLRRKPQTAC